VRAEYPVIKLRSWTDVVAADLASSSLLKKTLPQPSSCRAARGMKADRRAGRRKSPRARYLPQRRRATRPRDIGGLIGTNEFV